MHQFHIFHETTYEYAQPVVLGEHELYLRPREDHDAKIIKSSLVIDPMQSVYWMREARDNSLAIVTFDDTPVKRLSVISELLIDQHLSGLPATNKIDPAITSPISYESQDQDSLLQWLLRRVEGERFEQWMNTIRVESDNSLQLLDILNESIFNNFEYAMREEPGVQSPDETLKLGRGSCRDFAWLFIIAARALGIAARFVSGYLHTSVEHLNSHTHAWAEVYLPKPVGWIGYDPTCNQLVSENHIPIAKSSRPEAVPPISGSYTGPKGIDVMDVKVKITQINQDPAQAQNQQVQDAPELEFQGPELQGPEFQGQRIPAQDILVQDIQAQESDGS